MELKSETINFLTFVVVGIVLGIVFDFFRAMRKVKKYSECIVYFQDIIYFVIVGAIVSSVLIYKMEYDLRVYLFISIILGVIIYIVTISKYLIRIFIAFIGMINSIVVFILLPFELLKNIYHALKYKIFANISFFLSKIKEKCCNKFFYVISYIYSIGNSFLKMLIFKRGNK